MEVTNILQVYRYEQSERLKDYKNHNNFKRTKDEKDFEKNMYNIEQCLPLQDFGNCKRPM